MKKNSKKILTIVICIIFAVGAYVTYSSIESKNNKKANEDVYETAKVKSGEIKVTVSSSGIVVPKNLRNPDYNDLQFQLTVDEMDIVNLKKDQTVNIEINAFPDKVFKGTIKNIAETGTTVNGVTTYPVLVTFDKKIDGLKSGMTGTSTITTEKKNNILYVPIDAINQKEDGENYVIDPSNGEEKTVKTGIHNDDSIQITEGLKEGDEVRLPTLVKKSSNGFPPMMGK